MNHDLVSNDVKTERLARWLLAPLLAFLVVVAILAP